MSNSAPKGQGKPSVNLVSSISLMLGRATDTVQLLAYQQSSSDNELIDSALHELKDIEVTLKAYAQTERLKNKQIIAILEGRS